MAMFRKKNLHRTSLLFIGATAIVSVLKCEIGGPLLYHTLRPGRKFFTSKKIFIPSTLDPERKRSLSISLGGGNCEWSPPAYEVPTDISFYKTIVAGYPSGDKRMAYLQMEALTGWPAKDEWDFAFLGTSNHPFIKANYPHHEGIWGWGSVADQVVLMVPFIRRAMVEYHDILWDLGYATTWEDAFGRQDKLYGELPPLEDYFEWRDARVKDEAHWYGWFIDYWMEGGLLRDIYTHKLVTRQHWEDLMAKFNYPSSELDYNLYVAPNVTVAEEYDPHCSYLNEVTNGCEPVAIISADKLRDYLEGPGETAAIATALMTDSKMGQYVIDQEAWDCVWQELIEKKKGPVTIYERPGDNKGAITDYNFSEEMLGAMIEELERLIAKYSSSGWNTKPTANRLVAILSEHLTYLHNEIQEVRSGARKLKWNDFLGDAGRNNRQDDELDHMKNREDHSKYFSAIEQQQIEKKRLEMKQAASTVSSRKDGRNSGKLMSDEEFTQEISNTVSRIRSMLEAGGMTTETAIQLMERIGHVTDAHSKYVNSSGQRRDASSIV